MVLGEQGQWLWVPGRELAGGEWWCNAREADLRAAEAASRLHPREPRRPVCSLTKPAGQASDHFLHSNQLDNVPPLWL